MKIRKWRQRRDEDLDQEIRTHLSMLIQDQMDRGKTREEAEAASRREFGNEIHIKEVTRDMWGWVWLDQLFRDLRYGLRQLRRSPVFTAMAVITLALGIGAATAVFSLVNATLLNDLPYRDAGRIIHIARIIPQTLDPVEWGSLEYNAWKASARSCNAVAAFINLGATISGSAGSETPFRAKGAVVSREFFSLLDVPAAIGRIPSPYLVSRAETPSIVISQALFKSRFSGNRNLIGQALRLEGISRGNGLYVLAGIMPADFQLPFKTDFWLPVEDLEYGEIIARLAPGVSITQAKAELDAIRSRIKVDPKRQSIDTDARIIVTSLRDYLIGDVGISMLVLLGAVVLVMLIVCINVANLLLLRNQKRRHEMSVRAAIGATRFRLARQTLAESGLLAFLGGGLGFLLAWWMIHLLPLFAPRGVLREHAIRLDVRILLFAAFITGLAGILVALLPALRQPWSTLAEAIKRSGGYEATGDRKLFHSILVSAQIALTLMVLCGAGLMVRSFIAMRGGYPGAYNSRVLKLEIDLSAQYHASYQKMMSDTRQGKGLLEELARREQFFEKVRKQIGMLPEVKRVAVTARLPGDTRTGVVPLKSSPGQTGWLILPTNSAAVTAVSPDYFESLKIPLIAGRTFSESDYNPGSPQTVIINQTLAKIIYPGEDPVGKIYNPYNKDYRFFKKTLIVGIVGDMRNRGFRDATFPEVYTPLLRPFQHTSPLSRMSVVVEARGAARMSPEAIRAAVARVDPQAPVSGIMTMDEYIDSFFERDRFSVFLLSLFAVATLAIAAVGIYGVMTQSVEHRLREMAVRIALGATPGQVVRLVLARGAAQIVGGVAAGLLGAFYMTRALRALLVQVKPYDPGTFLSVFFLLLAVAFLACYGPASRAIKADPLSVLRAE
jgi:putative ABC transport system permease protein